MTYYKTFKRSCNSFATMSSARKIMVDTGITEQQAKDACKEFNDNRSAAQLRKGTKMEYTAI